MMELKRIGIGILSLLLVLEILLFANGGFFDESFVAGFHQGRVAWVYGVTQDEDLPGGEDPVTEDPSMPLEDPPVEEIPELLPSEEERREAEERGLLILVNKENPVESDYKPEDLAPVHYYAPNRTEAGRFMRKEAADQFHQLVEAAGTEGYTLVMTTAYRSYWFQQVLWDNYVSREGEEAASRFSARPGQSEHQTGLAVDVSSPSVNLELTSAFGETDEGRWLSENAHQFGFIIRYPKEKEAVTGYLYEPWHLRYVGLPIATALKEKGWTLEEYLDR